MKYKIGSLIVSLSLLLSCNTKRDNPVSSTPEKEEASVSRSCFTIDVAEIIKKPEKFTIPYSSCVKDIRYVPLETTDESLVGEGRHGIVMCVTQDMIVADMKVFDGKDGRFLFNLSQRGQGPKEYTYIKTVVGDDSRKEFYIHDHAGSKIMVYGYDGEYKYTVGGQGGNEIIPLGNGNILVNRSQSVGLPYFDYFVMNLDTQEILYRHVSSALRESGDMNKCKGFVKSGSGVSLVIGMNKFWKYNNQVYYYEYLTDSLFVINKQFSPEPIGYLNMSGLKMTKEQWLIPVSKQDFHTWDIFNFVETDDFLFIRLYCTGKGDIGSYTIVYNKKDNNVRCSKKTNVFKNDINYGEDINLIYFDPLMDTRKDACIYRFLSPTSIKENIDKKGLSTYKSGSAKAFKDIGDKLKDDDNPVVCIMTLK